MSICIFSNSNYSDILLVEESPMSIASIITELDAEISRLEQARAVLG